MSSSIASLPSAARTGLSHLYRALMIAVVLAAMGIVGMSMVGHSQSVAASTDTMDGLAPRMQIVVATPGDPSVPAASEVFVAGTPASEDAGATF